MSEAPTNALPPLLEEFQTAHTAATANPDLVKLANAKWQGALLAAVSESPSRDGQNIATICARYQELGTEMLALLDVGDSDPRVRNTALQALIEPASKELRETGLLSGAWLPQYAEAITQMPVMFKVATSPVSSSTSLGMTLTNHYADLFSAANDFAFLREPVDIVSWAHQRIDAAAKRSAERIAPHEERGVAYQNQLNVHRRLFLSAYRTEATEWQTLIDEHPETLPIYGQGMPLTGVEQRFDEQAQALQGLIDPERTPSPGLSR